MKFKLKRNPETKEFLYKEELQEELKNNSIVLSFALSIIVVGFISIFYNNSSSLLIGIAVSSLLLTLIQCFSNGNTMLNILPIFTLIMFGFFQKSVEKIPIINILLNEDYSNLIIFLAFSLTFLTQSYKNIVYKYNLKEQSVNYNLEKNKIIYSQLGVMKNITEKAEKVSQVIKDAGIKNSSLKRAVIDLENYVEDEAFVSNVKSSLIIRGSEQNKSSFNIEEVEESILMNNSSYRDRQINAGNEDYSEYADESNI